MPVVLEPDVFETHEREVQPSDGGYDLGGIYGRCPICSKPLRPRCRFTGRMQAPPPGTGEMSRAMCEGCGKLIVYTGNGEWRPLAQPDLSEDEGQNIP